MTSVAINVNLSGFGAIEGKLARLDNIQTSTLLEGLARLIQQQTQNRILDEKTSPDGAAWKANRTGTSVLHRSGALAASIDYVVNGAQAIVGSGLIYSAIHQFGGTITPKEAKALAFRMPGANGFVFAQSVTIPARPYIGLSGENRSELVRAAALFIRKLVGL